MKVVDVVAQRLYEAGIRYAFGIPGGEVVEMIEALRKTGIQFILTRHEMGAGMMADSVSRLTAAPCVLVGTLGPGLTNTVTPVAQAFLDRTPLIVITGSVSTKLENVYTHQIIDQESILKPITKYSVTLRHADAGEVVAKAIDIAIEGRPGPVHLNIPTDVAVMEEVANDPKTVRKIAFETANSNVPGTLMDLLTKATRPVAIAGLAVSDENTAASLYNFLTMWDIPLITTYKAKGVIPEDHPLSLGAAGLSPVVDRLQLQLLSQADLIITVGFDPVEMRSDWIRPWPDETNVVNIDAVPAMHRVFIPTYQYVGDIRRCLQDIQPSSPCKRWPREPLNAHRQSIQNAIASTIPSDRLSPYDVLSRLRQSLPRDTIACVDTGAHRILANHVWQCFAPNTLLQSNGLGTMGYALPAAIGAKLLHPERPVLCITGDAGFDMIMGELALLSQHHLAVQIVVLTDRALSLIKLKQERMNLPTYGVDFDIPDYASVAEAFGGTGFRVNNHSSLMKAIDAAQSNQSFTLIQAEIEPAEYRIQM